MYTLIAMAVAVAIVVVVVVLKQVLLAMILQAYRQILRQIYTQMVVMEAQLIVLTNATSNCARVHRAMPLYRLEYVCLRGNAKTAKFLVNNLFNTN